MQIAVKFALYLFAILGEGAVTEEEALDTETCPAGYPCDQDLPDTSSLLQTRKRTNASTSVGFGICAGGYIKKWQPAPNDTSYFVNGVVILSPAPLDSPQASGHYLRWAVVGGDRRCDKGPKTTAAAQWEDWSCRMIMFEEYVCDLPYLPVQGTAYNHKLHRDPWTCNGFTSSTFLGYPVSVFAGSGHVVTDGLECTDFKNASLVMFNFDGIPMACGKMQVIAEDQQAGEQLEQSFQSIASQDANVESDSKSPATRGATWWEEDVYVVLDFVRYDKAKPIAGNAAIRQRQRQALTLDGVGQNIFWGTIGTDPRCVNGPQQKDYSCGLTINEATSCKEAPGKTLFNHETRLNDPWLCLSYTSIIWNGSSQATMDNWFVWTGLQAESLNGHVMVIHDFNGKPEACGIIEKEKL